MLHFRESKASTSSHHLGCQLEHPPFLPCINSHRASLGQMRSAGSCSGGWLALGSLLWMMPLNTSKMSPAIANSTVWKQPVKLHRTSLKILATLADRCNMHCGNITWARETGPLTVPRHRLDIPETGVRPCRCSTIRVLGRTA